jgi:isoquinoline 1-oxidoreductase beta subunit
MVDWTKVKVVASPAGPTYGNPLFGGYQGTFGSYSMRGFYQPMRVAGATVREMLKAAAAQAWNVPVASVTAASGAVSLNGASTIRTYGQLAASAALQAPPTNPPLLGSGQYIGKSMPRADLPAKVNGSAIYGIDVQMAGMLCASVLNSPVFGGTLPAGSLPVTPAGCVAVVGLGNAVAVVAHDTYAAIKGARSLTVNWSLPAGATQVSNGSILSAAQKFMTNGPAQTAETVGNAAAAYASAPFKLDQTYTLPFVPHACMEVLNCTAVVTANSCTIWAPTQSQANVVATAAALTGLPSSAITLNTTFLGGGLGRKLETDFISQAILIAMAMKGTPVKMTWSREEDFRHDQYRPMALSRVQAGYDAAGNILAWSNRLVAPSYAYQHGGSIGVDFLTIPGAIGLPYAFGSRLVEYVRHTATVPVGSWRSIGCSINNFVVESALDEIAVATGVDPLALRQNLLQGNARALAVLDAAATMGGWSTPTPAGHARGLAFCASDNGFVAQVIELTRPTKSTVKVLTVSCAVDVGLAVNPDCVTAQIEGGVVHGLSSSLWGQMPIGGGKAQISNFDNYRMMRMSDMPVINVQIINGGGSLGGAGEISVPPVAPAVASALARLKGARIRSLPILGGGG